MPSSGLALLSTWPAADALRHPAHRRPPLRLAPAGVLQELYGLQRLQGADESEPFPAAALERQVLDLSKAEDRIDFPFGGGFHI